MESGWRSALWPHLRHRLVPTNWLKNRPVDSCGRERRPSPYRGAAKELKAASNEQERRFLSSSPGCVRNSSITRPTATPTSAAFVASLIRRPYASQRDVENLGCSHVAELSGLGFFALEIAQGRGERLVAEACCSVAPMRHFVQCE